MKILYSLKNNFKIALTLTVLLVCLILTSQLEKQHLKEIDKGFSSMFADRLVPATDMFSIADQLYERRMLLQSYLLAAEKTPMPPLEEEYKPIDSLLAKYRETYLVEEEVVCFETLMAKWSAYKHHETKIIALTGRHSNDQAILLFNTEGQDLFRSIIADLEKLSRIQSQVGENLMASSRSNIASTHSLLSIQSAIIIIVALITNIFLLASKAIVQPKQKFHLN